MRGPDPVDLLAAGDPVAAFVDAEGSGRDIALPTSGTSARPRTIVRSTTSWVDSFPTINELIGLDRSSRVWVPGPLTATMNLFASVHTRWAGAKLAPTLASATHAHLSPTALHHLLAAKRGDLAGVHLVVAGDRVDAATRERVLAAGGRLSHYYGAAELSFVAWGGHSGDLRPFPGVQVESRGGELWVRSPFVSRGYLEPEHALRTDGNGWVTVGDRGELTDGLVHVHGREGGITTAGATVTIADIEHVLRPCAAGEVVIVGVPHPDLGQIVGAVVSDADDRTRLEAVAKDSLTSAQRPRRWLHLDPIPRTRHDKIDRTAVQAAVAAMTGAGEVT